MVLGVCFACMRRPNADGQTKGLMHGVNVNDGSKSWRDRAEVPPRHGALSRHEPKWAKMKAARAHAGAGSERGRSASSARARARNMKGMVDEASWIATERRRRIA